MARPKLQSIITSKGEAKFPHLNLPDTKYKKEGEYHVKLILPADDPKLPEMRKLIAEATEKAVDEAAEKALAKSAKLNVAKFKETLKRAASPIKVFTDADGNEDESKVEVSFKLKAHVEPQNGKPGWDQRPKLWDAKLQNLDPAKVKIGGGSIIKIKAEFVPFFTTKEVGAGCQLRMIGVQVIELRAFGGRSASEEGFEEEEGLDSSTLAQESDAGDGAERAQGDDKTDETEF